MMSGKLQQQIKKRNPFDSIEQEAHLNLMRTADLLERAVTEEVFKPAGLSRTQYNVLRILRGSGEEGLTCGECGSRMITQDPDITRLFDRLEKRGLIERHRCTEDRRVVRTRITAAGLDLLASLDEPVLESHRRHLGHLGPEKLSALVDLLEEARSAVEG